MKNKMYYCMTSQIREFAVHITPCPLRTGAGCAVGRFGVTHLRVLAVEQVAHGRHTPGLHQMADLLGTAADGQVAAAPGALLLRLELAAGQVVHHQRHQAVLDHQLHLVLVTGRDVGEEPGRLLGAQTRGGRGGGTVSGVRRHTGDSAALTIGRRRPRWRVAITFTLPALRQTHRNV